MPKTDGSPTKGEVSAEQLRQTREELSRLAQQLTLREEGIAEKSAAVSLAEQLQALRSERKEGNRQLPSHRPSEYSPDEAAALCQWICEGKSLRSWCRQTGRAAMTVYRWIEQEASFREQYARAHEDRADTMAEDIIEIADEVAGTDSIAAVQAAKLRIETRKWIAAKVRPSKWGEKQLIETSGSVTFNLGIAPRQVDPVTIDAEAIQISGLQLPQTECESVSQLDEAPRPPAQGHPSSPLSTRSAPSPGRAAPHPAGDEAL